jgi:hypothetical protein
MTYDEGVARRLREFFAGRDDVTEKKMFGGVVFLVRGNMCCGVVYDTLMARVGAENYEQALRRPHAREMTFTGRPMRGFVTVEPEGFESDAALRDWVSLCDAFVRTLPRK